MATRNVEMIYENGVLRPLEPLNLQEGERIRVAIQPSPDDEEDAYLAHLRAKVATYDRIPTLEEVRAITAKMSSLSKTVIEERGEY
jgi:predicted DNA-binding antitoxin AbrB/MazE fold protein